jgi:predicted RNase H-like HicB family nuclease
MQYQVFIESEVDRPRFSASVVEMPSVSVKGSTEAEAVINVKAALKEKLAIGKFISIDLDTPEATSSELPGAGIFTEDSTFDDWMDRLAEIRRVENSVDAGAYCTIATTCVRMEQVVTDRGRHESST